LRELKNRLSDNNTRVRERATEVILAMCLHPHIGVHLVVSELSKPHPA